MPPKGTAFNQFLGTEIEHRAEGEARVVLDLEPHHLNRRGVAHGGVVSAMLDTALGAAVISAIPQEWWCATISISIQYVAGARGKRLTAHGHFLRRGARIAFARGEVRDDRDRVVAVAEGSWHLWPFRPGTEEVSHAGPYVVMRGSGNCVRVGKIVAVGHNYAAHVAEMGAPKGGPPVLFFKPSTALVPNGGTVVLPAGAGEVHHEVEMVAVIGKQAKAVDESDALSHVLGFAVGLDMTLRDIQSEAKKKGGPWSVAKGFDTSAPVSPVAPRDEVGDGIDLRITLDVNGERRQDGSTGMMLRSTASLVALASRYLTLEPGDLLFTGTPEGVGPVLPGDTLRAELERVGSLEVSVVEET